MTDWNGKGSGLYRAHTHYYYAAFKYPKIVPSTPKTWRVCTACCLELNTMSAMSKDQTSCVCTVYSYKQEAIPD